MTDKRARLMGKLAGLLRKRAMPQAPMFGKLRGGNSAMATGYGAPANGGSAMGGGMPAGQNTVFQTLQRQRAKAQPTGPSGQAMTTPQSPRMPVPGMAVANAPQLPITPAR